MVKKLIAVGIFSLFILSYSWAANFSDSSIDHYLYPEIKKTISMDFKNAQLNDVLKVFSQQSGLNFIASTEVADKSVNLYLESVGVEEALERILSANNLTYELKAGSNIFIVKELVVPTKQVVTRVYPLKNATVPSSKLKKTLSGSDEEDSSTSSSSSSDEDSSSSNTIVAALKAILTENGSVIEDPRTNSLIVTDIPSQFPVIEQTIARLDVPVPQVLIEVEMMDVSEKIADKIGVKWGDTPLTFKGGEEDILDPFNTDNILEGGFKLADPQYRVGTISFKGLSYALQFLRTNTDTKNLARPRILTLNNETAEIQIKTDEAIGIAATTTTTEGTASSVQQAERVETGIFLKVTPQANVETSQITMAIEPKVIQATTGGTFSNQTFKDPEERGTKSILRIKDGDTIVIGGLLRTDVQDVQTKVPVLGDIPFLGAAFRHTDKTDTERELIIFITPHIISDDLALAQKSFLPQTTYEPDISPKRMKAIERALIETEKQK